MVDTLLDASAGSRVRFAREILSLTRCGLKARATQPMETSARQLAADGFCLAGAWLLTLFLISDLGERVHGPIPDYPQYLYAPWTLALLGAALALAVIGYDRLAGATALLFTASILVDPAGYDLTNAQRVRLVVPAICFSMLLFAPRRRKPNARRLAWLPVVAAIAVGSGASDDPMALIAALALVLLLPPSLAMIRTNPRPAIACALCAAYFGTHMAQDRGGPGPIGLLFLAAAPLVLATVMTRYHRTHVVRGL